MTILVLIESFFKVDCVSKLAIESCFQTVQFFLLNFSLLLSFLLFYFHLLDIFFNKFSNFDSWISVVLLGR